MPEHSDKNNQSNEILGICAEIEISIDELAGKVALKPETLRKIVGGHQAASPQLMQAMRFVLENERLRRGRLYPKHHESVLTLAESTEKLSEIAQTDPEKFRELSRVITTYFKSIRKPKKGPKRVVGQKIH